MNRSSTLSLKTTTATVSDKILTNKIVMADTGKIGIGLGVNTNGNSISIGFNPGNGNNTINMGRGSNQNSSSNNSIAIGFASGQNNNQGNNVSIGLQCANFSAGQETVLVGGASGYLCSGRGAVCIGANSGYNSLLLSPTYNTYSTNIGNTTGYSGQGINCVALGNGAGFTQQGNYAIAIGFQAGFNLQPANSIILNASNTSLSPSTTNAFYVNPVRSQTGVGANLLSWNSGTSEIYLNTSASKTFVIDHPIKNDKYLVHACLEGPEAGVYYRGEGQITNGDSVEIALPEYTKNFYNFTIQITPINSKNVYGVSMVVDGKFKVFGDNGEFFWIVHGTRQDIQVEPNISEVLVKGDGPYTYISK